MHKQRLSATLIGNTMVAIESVCEQTRTESATIRRKLKSATLLFLEGGVRARAHTRSNATDMGNRHAHVQDMGTLITNTCWGHEQGSVKAIMFIPRLGDSL